LKLHSCPTRRSSDLTAGLIGSRVAENSYTGATNNILGTINVLEASRLRRLRRVVYVSTFGVYDRAKINDSVVRETHPIGGHNLRSEEHTSEPVTSGT